MVHTRLHSANLQPGDRLTQIERPSFGGRSRILNYQVDRVLTRTLVLNAVRDDDTLSETELRISIDVNGVVTDKVAGTKGWDRRVLLYRIDDPAVEEAKAQNGVEDLKSEARQAADTWMRSTYDLDKASQAMDALDDYIVAAKKFDEKYGVEL